MPQKRKDLKIEGANLWYLVGLIATDGYLSPDRRHIDITAKSGQFLMKLKEQLGLNCNVCTKIGGGLAIHLTGYKLQIQYSMNF